MKACASIESMQVNRVKAVVILFEEQDLLIRRISSEHRDFGCGFFLMVSIAGSSGDEIPGERKAYATLA